MTDEPTHAESPVSLGQNPDELEFGCDVTGERVVIKFNTLVQWFDLDPEVAIDFAEAIINCAKEAVRRRPIVLPGVPKGRLN